MITVLLLFCDTPQNDKCVISLHQNKDKIIKLSIQNSGLVLVVS